MAEVASELGAIQSSSNQSGADGCGGRRAIVLSSRVWASGAWFMPTLSEARDQALRVIRSGLSAGDPTERSLALRARWS